MDTQSLPMFVPPRPWVATNDGSYLATPGEQDDEHMCTHMTHTTHTYSQTNTYSCITYAKHI